MSRRLSLLACAYLLGTQVYAEESPPEKGIETIYVTAEKRETSAQETAIALTAFTGEDLELRNIGTIEDLQFNVPNLVIGHNSQSPVTYAYIRGIGSDQLVAGFDPGVAYHVDGVYIGQPSSMPGDMWDMERVEVLRGVQGTLYGRNTTGGSINVITNDPHAGTEFVADATVGNYDRTRFRGVINGGNDTISGRVSFIADENEGYQDNGVGDNGDVTDYRTIRGKLKFDFGNGMDLVLSAQRFENEGNQSQKKGDPFTSPVYVGALPNGPNPRKVDKDHDEELDLDNDVFSARFTWDLGPVTFRSITGYIENEWFQSTDDDGSSNDIQFQDWDMKTEQVSQEFQLLSNGEGPWEWIVGAFWFDEELSTNFHFLDVFAFEFFNGGDLDTESVAAFGQVGYDFRPSGSPFKVVVGGRWTKDKKEIDEYQFVDIPSIPLTIDLAGQMDDEWDEWSGKAEFDWFTTDDVMTYVTLSHGYKGGGYSIGQFDAFDPEFVDSVELGVKSQFLDNRAQVNVAAFYNKYDDLQVNFLTGINFVTDNAAEATIQGIELESLWVPIDPLQLSVAVTWLDATFDDYQFSATENLKGDRLNRAPEYTYQISAQYDFGLGDYGTLSFRGDYYWQDKVYYRVQNIPRHGEDAFDTLNLNVTWTSVDEQFVVNGFMDNAQDEDNLRGILISDGTSIGNMSNLSYFPPKVYGVRVSWHYGER